ncbi:unnamed protein product, partial [Nippostrongylus brasiliensis]|uniref:MADF domain-containing protein n=1 Tax=Nippostrongylus brasiliensis TaxID=27835 RepID=A0A0N4YGH5_NIPBR
MENHFLREFKVQVLQRTYKSLRDVFVKKRRDLREQLVTVTGADAAANLKRKVELWPHWHAMQFLEKCADTGERHVSTPQSSSARDDTIDLTEDVENVPPESSPVAELGRNPKPKRRPSNTVLEQLSTAVND